MEKILLAFAALSCPIGMGAMMWFMAKGMMGSKREGPAAHEDLRRRQAHLEAEIGRRERDARERVEA